MSNESGGIIAAINSLIPGGITNLFNLGLGLGAILAFGTIIYAGVLYSVAGDNVSRQKEAKEWIYAAAKGLILLAFGVVLINIINPRLLRIQDATTEELPIIPMDNKIRTREDNPIELFPPPADHLPHLPRTPDQH